MTSPLGRLLREPLFHFLLLGMLLFALYGWINRDALRKPDEIIVDQTRVAALASQFQRVWQRPPSRDELRDLIDAWVREEMVYREGIAAGMEVLDKIESAPLNGEAPLTRIELTGVRLVRQ